MTIKTVDFDLSMISCDGDEFVARYTLQMLSTDAGKDTFDKNVTMVRLALTASSPAERFASYQSRAGEYTRVLPGSDIPHLLLTGIVKESK